VGRRSGQPEVVVVQNWGPEPIGAGQSDALHAQLGADLSGATVLVAPGFWPTSDATYVSPQSFGAQGAMRAPVTAMQEQGLPAGTDLSGLPNGSPS
jgi:hypothetical protein